LSTAPLPVQRIHGWTLPTQIQFLPVSPSTRKSGLSEQKADGLVEGDELGSKEGELDGKVDGVLEGPELGAVLGEKLGPYEGPAEGA
jgi:hypothetical protein